MTAERKRLPEHPDEVRMSVGEHLEELRRCLFKSLIALVIACVACIYPARWIFELVTRPLILALRHQGQVESLLQTGPLESFMIYVKVVVIAGLILASPYILYQLWSFIGAGLYRKERAFVYKMIGPSIGLFIAGVAFMYCFVLLLSLNFLIGFGRFLPMPDAQPSWLERKLLGAPEVRAPASQPETAPSSPIAMLVEDPADPPLSYLWYNLTEGRLKLRLEDHVVSTPMRAEENRSLVETHFKIGDYLSFVLMLTVAFGLAFQMPLVVVFLAASNIMPVKTMRSYRRVVILVIVFIAGALAPPDILSHLMLSGPMWLLFEIGLLIAARKSSVLASAGEAGT